MRICRRVGNPPLTSILLANVQSLENKLDELRLRLSYQRDMKNCNILCFTESWLNDDTYNIQMARFSLHLQDRTAMSGKMGGAGVCLFVNNSWCAMSNIKEVEYLMISCRPNYLPIEFSSIFFVAAYLPPQTYAGTKTTLNEL